MPDWLKAIENGEQMPGWDAILIRLTAAMLLGGAAAAIYAWTHRRDETLTRSFLATLVLLSILLATVTQVIGDNLARAFGLVGALAIVRFRTVVEDARDTAFVMLAVVLGMAAGAGHAGLGVAALGFAAVVAAVLQPARSAPVQSAEAWTLSIRLGVGHNYDAVLQPAFGKFLESYRLLSSATARQGAAIELNWAVTLRNGGHAANLVAELNRLEGVQNVELRRMG